MIRVALCVVAATVTVTAVAAAHPEATKQRVAITAKGVANPSSFGKFVLTPLQTGTLKADSGTETSSVSSERVVMREGQEVKIVNWTTTCKGKRGSFVIRVRLEQVEAGNGYHVSIGSWTFVRGTGTYAHVSGGGRIGNAWIEGGAWSERRAGFLTVR
jgi:hypothetical protein